MSRQLFSGSSIWERKAKLTCLINHFQTKANWWRRLKGNKPSQTKLQNFKAKWTFKKNFIQVQWNENIPHAGLKTFHVSVAEPLVQRPTTETAMKRVGQSQGITNCHKKAWKVLKKKKVSCSSFLEYNIWTYSKSYSFSDNIKITCKLNYLSD